MSWVMFTFAQTPDWFWMYFFFFGVEVVIIDSLQLPSESHFLSTSGSYSKSAKLTLWSLINFLTSQLGFWSLCPSPFLLPSGISGWRFWVYLARDFLIEELLRSPWSSALWITASLPGFSTPSIVIGFGVLCLPTSTCFLLFRIPATQLMVSHWFQLVCQGI